MNIDDLKKEFKNMRKGNMDISINEFNNLDNFIQSIQKQDRDDEKYMLHNKIFPIIAGLFILIILMLINPIKSVLLIIGMFLIFIGLIWTLILLFIDYKNISREAYDLSMFTYLKQKEKRLKSWRSTPVKYYWTFILFLTGLILMIVGNTSLMRDFSTEYIILFITFYLVFLITFWILGEHYYRKRHQKKHQPLLKIISKQIEELDET